MKKIPVYDVKLVRARKPIELAEGFASHGAQAARVLHGLIGLADREHFACLFLGADLSINGAHVAAVGGQRDITLDARPLFRAAILARAHAMILGHNHPSGSVEASPEDLAATDSLVYIGKTLDISIVDHVIVVPNGESYYSMSERGTLPRV